MSFQMLKRTRKRRGGDLYAGQLEPAIKAATELATVLSEIAKTLPPSDPNASSVPASSVPASSVTASNVTPAPASNDAAYSHASSAPASNAAPDSYYNESSDDGKSFVISGTKLTSVSIKKILDKMITSATDDATKQKLQTILSEISAAPNGKAIAQILANHNIQLAAGTKNIFTMSGGTKKRKMHKRTNRRKTRKMKKTKKMRKMMRKMRKTMKL